MNLLRCIAVICLFSLITGCARDRGELGTGENPVKLFFVPSVDAKVIANRSKEIQAYLEANTPYKFEVKTPPSYIAVVESFGTWRADVAALNTFGYILAHEKYNAEARLTVLRYGRATYRSQIIARADSGIEKVEDLAGKKFAYVDAASTSGYLLPRKMFKDHGIAPAETTFAGTHANVVSMVYQRQVDAGATFHSPVEDGKIQDARRLVKTQYPDVEDVIRIVQLTDEIPNDPIVFRKELSEEMKETITAAFLAYLDTEEGRTTFHDLYGVTAMRRSTDADYAGVREMIENLGTSADDLMKKE